jgi:hypothetical protein
MALVGVGFNGASFLNYGEAVSSLLMACLFAVSLAAYIGGPHAASPLREMR